MNEGYEGVDITGKVWYTTWIQSGVCQMQRMDLQMGDRVRTGVKGQRPRAGLVVGESREGQCWLIDIGKGRVVEYHKSHCERVRSNQMSKQARSIRSRPTGHTKVYGDGEID